MADKTTTRPQISPVAQQIATELGETMPGAAKQIAVIVRLLGEERALAILAQAKDVEVQGGMLIPDGSRRHTFGGVFFRLVREQATPEQRATMFLPKTKRKPKRPPTAPAVTPPAAA